MTIIPQKYAGDCRQIMPGLPTGKYQLCVTSPPYWGLRSYLPKNHPLKHLEIGCEPTIEEYLAHLGEVFEEVRRLLRDDGTLFVNMGDCYRGNPPGNARRDHSGDSFVGTRGTQGAAAAVKPEIKRTYSDVLKPKDLCMVPFRVAALLQWQGWYLRSIIPWIKRNCMPESVTDRPAMAVEYFLMFSKSEDYFWDPTAVMMRSSDNTHPRTSKNGSFTGNRAVDRMRKESEDAFPGLNGRDRYRSGINPKANGDDRQTQGKQRESFAAGCSQYVVGLRNRRNSDWFMESWQGLMLDEQNLPMALVVNTKGTTIKHFASYPPKLIEPIIAGATSDNGCCGQCCTPWERVTWQPAVSSTLGWQPGCECFGKRVRKKVIVPARMSKDEVANWGADKNGEYLGLNLKDYKEAKAQEPSTTKARIIHNATHDREVEAWVYESDLPLEQHPVGPCTVFDPFWGTGCTGEVSTGMGRHSEGCELNPEYFKASDARDGQGAFAIL